MTNIFVNLYQYKTDTHFCQRNQEKCGKSRLVTTSAIKHFTPKVAEFYLKSGVLLPSSTYMVVWLNEYFDVLLAAEVEIK